MGNSQRSVQVFDAAADGGAIAREGAVGDIHCTCIGKDTAAIAARVIARESAIADIQRTTHSAGNATTLAIRNR